MEKGLVLITFLYSIAGIISVIAYLPTIKDLWFKKPSANIFTYYMWTFTTMTSSIYGFLVLKNGLFCITIIGQATACIIILILSLRLKIQEKTSHFQK